MTREEATQWLIRPIVSSTEIGEFKAKELKAYELAIEALSEPKTGWIPVSERLPEKNGCYLVSTTGENNYIIDIAFYIEGMWHKTSRIKAWMPLPEPYEEEVSSMNRDYMTIDRLVAMVDALIRKEELCEGCRIDGDHGMSCSKCRELAADRIIEILQGE